MRWLTRGGVAAAVVALIVVVVSLGGGGNVAFAGDLRRGGTLESLTLPALEGDGVVDYAAYDDRPLVINFFASWCPSCIAEMPDFERVSQDVGAAVTFLGVSQSDATQSSIDLAHETGITYPTAIDGRGEFFNALGAQGMPTTVFVRPGGEIADIWVGQLDDESLRDLLTQHFGV